jgi:hypothetical protein
MDHYFSLQDLPITRAHPIIIKAFYQDRQRTEKFQITGDLGTYWAQQGFLSTRVYGKWQMCFSCAMNPGVENRPVKFLAAKTCLEPGHDLFSKNL